MHVPSSALEVNARDTYHTLCSYFTGGRPSFRYPFERLDFGVLSKIVHEKGEKIEFSIGLNKNTSLL